MLANRRLTLSMLTPYAHAMRLTRKAFKQWGRTGGKTRAANLTPEQRKAIARKAAKARWAEKEKK